MDKRKTIELLPSYLRSESLSKFFTATVDHLFQPESVEFLSGYVGIKPSWYDSAKDFYISEPSKNRQDYQLTPTAVSTNFQDGNITNALFYDDLINQLRFQGAITTNHSRLFDTEYYSWSPPIDLDKFVNFSKYYWLASGDAPKPIELLDTTDLNNDALNKKNYTYSGYVKYTSTGEIEYVTLPFTTGLSISPTADKSIELNNTTIYVDGVGKSIYLDIIPDQSIPGWDVIGWDLDSWDVVLENTDKQYITISRSSIDGNQWSSTNRWFHIDTLKITKTLLSDINSLQAKRPIIEFAANIELYNYGTHDRGTVDIADTQNPNFLGTIVGQSSWSIDTVPLQNGMRIMGISEVMKQNFPDEYGKIYIVSGVGTGSISLTLDTTNTNDDGSATNGDRVYIKFGLLQGYNLYFENQQWNSNGQQKFGVTTPIFNLYDYQGNKINNPVLYPSSTFTGSKVFSYAESDNSLYDTELGINTKLDQFGDFIFNNDLAIETVNYISDATQVTYTGYLFAKIGENFTNCWNTALEPSKQYIVNEFVANGTETIFTIDQTPAAQIDNTLPNIFVSVIKTDFTETLQIQGVDYFVSNNQVIFTLAPAANSRIVIKSWSKAVIENIKGYYDIPINLSANPNNEDVTAVSRSQFLKHFLEIIGNQTGIIGNILGSNNYRDTAENLSLGLSILQHRAPMLKLSVMNSTDLEDITSISSKIDPVLAIQNAQKSYIRFYSRFLQALFNQSKLLGGNTSISGCDPTFINQMVSAALQQINVGKTTASAWANSGPSSTQAAYCSQQISDPTWVPATATRLGITPAYQPMVYMDTSYTVPQMVIQCHDGSKIVMVNEQGEQLGTFVHGQTITTNPEELTNAIAAAWLQFELNLFNNLPDGYKNVDAKYTFDVRTYMPGKWRTSDYSRDEILSLQRASFEKWTITNQIDYRPNTGYNTTNPFSYNYRNVVDKQGQPVPGHWQGIYKWFYDTDRPHSHPWEMLGFSQKPDWWNNEYGPAPYTNGNTALWSDLSQGIVRQGERQGQYIAWARPGLLDCIPVDNQGNLLPPYQAGCVNSIPDVYSAAEEWKFGDGSPIETAWTNSQEYSFILAQTGYLMKPARFIEYTWDSLRTVEILQDQQNSQWIYVDTNKRRSSNEFYVHREQPNTLSIGINIPNESNLSYFGSCGFQHWVSEYLVNDSYSVTEYFGNVIRGANVQLAHRMAGFVNTDTVRTIVDSFGDIGYQSQIIPNDNISISLYRSTSIGEGVYSGVLVEQVKGGWKIFGYDNISQKFTIIPNDIYGPKTTVVIGNQRAIEYKMGLNTTENVLYGTVFSTRQMVYDFLIAYGRYLTSQGWRFDQFNSDGNEVLDWSTSAKEFLFWSQGDWQDGTFITLSPGAAELKYFQEYGNIQFVNGIVAGTYPLVDRAGSPIQPQNVITVRGDNDLVIKTNNSQGIFGARLYRTSIEHAIFWKNVTAFNDIVYQPLYNDRQLRIKVYGYRANDWNGRVDIPGYILVKNNSNWSIVPNFDSTANQITKYYNIEQPKNYNRKTGSNTEIIVPTELGAVSRQNIQNLARHMLGYQNRLYLQDLLLEDATEFQFYTGFVRNKGTRTTLDRLLRNTAIIPANSGFAYFEEWLIRIGYYGAYNLNNLIEYRIPQSQISGDPQWIRLFSTNDSDAVNDDVIEIVPNDPLIVVPPESYQDKLFSLRTSYSINPETDLPLAGYAQLGETSYTVNNTEELLNLWSANASTSPLLVGSTIWQFVTDNGSWNTWILAKAPGQVDTTVPSLVSGSPTVITTTEEHGLIDGDIVVIYGVTGVSGINGTYIVDSATPLTFQISISTFEPGTGGTILVYRPTRFATVFDRDSGEPPGGWPEGALSYVDNGGQVNGAWTVYKYLNGQWLPYRQQEYKVDSSLMKQSKLYNARTKKEIAVVTYYDPAQGRISGKADAEITYKLDYDPAKYNKGDASGYELSPSEAWGSAQVGQVWWDLSTVRYIDYEQGDDRYRIQHWGKIAPGTSVDIYEWIRTTIPPTDWATAVSKGESVTENGRSYIPSGSIKDPSNPYWTEITEYGAGNTATVYYYYWVKNSLMPPSSSDRNLTTLVISNLIQNPSIDDLPWYAAISSRSIILGNIGKWLDANNIVHSILYSSIENDANNYSQWQLIREGDKTSPISDNVWNKLKSSLITFDGMNNDVPDYKLPSIQQYGTSIRPRQSWFENRESASKVFIDTFNSIISNTITPMVDNSTIIGWDLYFNAAEPVPPQSGNWNYGVQNFAERDALIGAILPGQTVLVEPMTITNNLWTIWRYQAGLEPWTLIRQQTYNTANYWKYIDWYFAGYSSSTIVDITVDTNGDLRTLSNIAEGTIVKVLNNGNNKWQLYVYLTDWVLVGQQDGSIEILPSVYKWNSSSGSFDNAPFASIAFDNNASVEFGNIIDGIKYKIFSEPNSIELNQLFFACINYVTSEQTNIDWLIKTSNIVVKGFDQPLTQSPILQVDTTESIIGFLNEAKPYHVKIREFVSGKSYQDIANISVVDFDRPPGSPYTNEPATGTAERSYYNTYQAWNNNYLTHPELIRTLSAKLVFDRITTPGLLGAWDYIWDTSSWDILTGINTGAVGRINDFYQPTAGMIPKIIEELMSGIMYKGTRLAALGFNFEVGWSNSAWGMIGWDANTADIEAYLDLIVQGGIIPRYDTAIGDGVISQFPIVKDVSNPNEIVVWSDGGLRVYGLDWYVPTYAATISIVDGGTGYVVGDQLDLIAGNHIAAVRLRVTAVSGSAITSVEILSKGSYITVLPGPYPTEYPILYPGAGSNALIGVDWACNSIKFTSPPASSLTPNVYALYIGTTFAEAPANPSDTVYNGNDFVQPTIDENHPEELYLARIRDSIMVDVLTSTAGGRPIVSSILYTTDGVTSQYSLNVIPQDNDSVQAYLNGTLLKEGIANDYVINYDTGTLVFITVPTAAQLLQIYSIGVGGGSRQVKNAYTVAAGSGYLPGTIINLDESIGVSAADLVVRTVKAVSLSITSGGNGYLPNDILLLNEGNGVVENSNVTLIKVTSTTIAGSITAAEILNPGEWSTLPTSNNYTIDRTTDDSFVPAVISITWGVVDTNISNPGLYGRKPTQPVSQQSSTQGTGATFQLEFTSNIFKYEYTGDGVQTDFSVPNANLTEPAGIFVTVDGEPTTIASRLTGAIRLAIAPAFGATVIINTFNSDQFSVIDQTSITVTNPAVLSYTINSQPNSTVPNYLTTHVLLNGSILDAPTMQQFKGDGVQTVYNLTIDITGALTFDVYVDQQITSAFILSGSTITFTATPALNADIQVVVVKATTAYTISSNIITFASGILSLNDDILITTYTQDIDYEYHSETYSYNSNGQYILTKSPYDLSNIRVYVDSVIKTPGIDYTVLQSNTTTVSFNPDYHTATQVRILYMVGLPNRPAIAWRTLINSTETITTAIDLNRQTSTLSNVYTYSSSIEIEDYSKISVTSNNSGRVYIGDELIEFGDIVMAPTITYPNRAFLHNLKRNNNGTSGSPQSIYNIQYYNGDGTTVYFATQPVGQAIAETVYVDNEIQINTQINSEIGDYEFVINPPSLPAGRYIRFINSAPRIGYKNIKIANLNQDSGNLSHVIGASVLDAGDYVTPPMAYSWEAASNGLQYSTSNQANFYLSHPYTG